ncbi:ammonium transporter [Janibacter sp. CX7]|jgi:Amt family ammonium transporter|uniref:ammonium transporter n=1 Tax=unclassified Janibacter TaxID=2649294 RepID=UPI0020CD4F4F|nr:ammonium transporter [Janibacter sp. CX7]UTT67055.1 ammonium transporter [Janibacter sp. CX7]
MSPAITPLAANPPAIDTSATAFMIICAALVLLMTPGLALFYGGMTRAKSVLNMMMMSFGAMGVAGVVYVLWGYSMSFGGSDIGGIFANPFDKFGLRGVASTVEGVTGTVGADGMPVIDVFGADVFIPEVLFAGFQLTFAIITVALISGAIADRAKFSTWLVFCAIWLTVVYFPIAHMVWGGGLLSGAETSVASWLFGSTDGAATIAPIDFAGGTVVHINAGIAGLVLALVVGKRLGFGKTAMRPHNVPLVMIGAGLLWFGWFGFNAGSELAADGVASLVWVNTTAATAAAILGWLLVEKLRDGHATSVGAASGVVAGLVAITPACGALSPVGSLVLGLVAGALAALAVGLKFRFGYDDSLDVVGVHLVAGLWGTVGAGLLATDGGLLYGDGFDQTLLQIVVALISLVISAVLTFVIAIALKATMGWRIAEDDEVSGIDSAEHAESGYDLGGVGASRARSVLGSTLPTRADTVTESEVRA